jgi:hypothetical protein
LIDVGCDSSAGITRIRFAGRGLMALLSAWQHQAPRANWLVVQIVYAQVVSLVKEEFAVRSIIERRVLSLNLAVPWTVTSPAASTPP